MNAAKARSEFKFIANTLNDAAEQGLNVLLRGDRGVGKTHLVFDAAKKLDLRIKYFSASTLDPFADLVGIPVPDQEKSCVRYLRAEDINDAEFMFFDELNRAHKRVTNAVLEIIQFKAINGEPLKNLKFVWAAVNPWGKPGYDTEELDLALMDRFPVQIDVPYCLNPNYFGEKFGDRVAKEAYNWWEELGQNLKLAVSPRRLDYLVDAILTGGTLYRSLSPLGYVLPLDALRVAIETAKLAIDFNTVKNDPEKFAQILENGKISDTEFNATCNVLKDATIDQLSQIPSVVAALPGDYLSNILIRSPKNSTAYADFRHALYNRYGLSVLMATDSIIQKRFAGA